MPRRILLLITDLDIGGTPTVVRELAARLHAPPEVTIEVACLSKWGPVADQIRSAGVPVTALNARGARDLPSAVRRLRALVRDRGIDTVFSFLVHANFVAALASRKLPGVRFLQSIQTTQPRPRWHWHLQRLVARSAERVVVPSESVAAAAGEWSRVPRSRIVVIPNGVDPDSFERSTVPAQDPRPYPVAFIGRLDPIKRADSLADAVLRLKGLARLDLWGEGPARVTVAMTLEHWGDPADSLVMLHGAIADPRPALSRAGMLVLPSEAEGFGLVLIEAMAAGVPVIGTDVPGIRDVIRHEENGLLVEGKYPIGPLVDAMRRIVEDRALRERLVRNGLEDVRRRFAWSNVVRAYKELLGIPAC